MPINTTILNTNESHSTLITNNVAAQCSSPNSIKTYLHQLSSLETSIPDSIHRIWSPSIHWWITFLSSIKSSRNHYTLWMRQDELLLNVILGSLSPTIMSFITQAQTSKEAWTILADTYAKPSCGRIKQVKNQLKQITKGSIGVSEFLQTMKARDDELAILGALVDIEDLLERILEGLGAEYK